MAPRRVRSAPGDIELNRHFGAETDLWIYNAPQILLFTYYSLIKLIHLLQRKPAKISCERKTIKWAKKKNSYKGKEKEKRAREKIVMDSQKGPNFMAYAHARKQKAA